MVAVAANYAGRLTSVPNFRLLYASCDHSDINDHSGLIYRSSRPDFVGYDELKTFRELKIKSIIDFRSRKEYVKADGNHLLDEEYRLYQVKLPRGRNFRHGEKVTLNKLIPKQGISSENPNSQKKHFLINFFTANYIWTVFNRAPWYIRLYSFLFLIYDVIFSTGYKYFVRLFARTTLNSTGLIGQYKDIVELSQRSICAGELTEILLFKFSFLKHFIFYYDVSVDCHILI